MTVEWQGDHKLLDAQKEAFERELERLGFGARAFLAVVRREPDLPRAEGTDAVRFNVFITDLDHPDRDTWKLEAGGGKNWVAQFAKLAAGNRG